MVKVQGQLEEHVQQLKEMATAQLPGVVMAEAVGVLVAPVVPIAAEPMDVQMVMAGTGVVELFTDMVPDDELADRAVAVARAVAGPASTIGPGTLTPSEDMLFMLDEEAREELAKKCKEEEKKKVSGGDVPASRCISRQRRLCRYG